MFVGFSGVFVVVELRSTLLDCLLLFGFVLFGYSNFSFGLFVEQIKRVGWRDEGPFGAAMGES